MDQALRFVFVRRRVIFNKKAQSFALKAVQNLDFNQPPLGVLARWIFFEMTACDAARICEAIGIR